MRNVSALLTVFCITAMSASLTAQPDSPVPPIRSIDRTCLPAGPPRQDLPLYTTDLAEQYQEVATIDSFLSTDKCEDTTRQQLKDLQAKGQAAGADALIRVRPLANNFTGWQENRDTPFWSVKQGSSKDYFFRATAIKYRKWPQGEPQPMAIRVAEKPRTAEVSPLVDTNQLLKLNRGRARRNEVSVPEVYTTQQP